MRSVSEMVISVLPACVALLLLAFFAAPLRFGGAMLCPNIGMVVTVALVPLLPGAWPRFVAVLFGVAQDLLFGVPLGVHALLLLVMVGVCERMDGRSSQPFQLRWLAAARVLLGMHLALWVLLHLVQRHAPGLVFMLQSTVVSALWYPIFYFIFSRLRKVV